MLGDQRRGIGGRAITAIVSVIAAWVFGTTAWAQFASMQSSARVFSTVVFVLIGAGAIWLIYGLLMLLRFLYRKMRGNA